MREYGNRRPALFAACAQHQVVGEGKLADFEFAALEHRAEDVLHLANFIPELDAAINAGERLRMRVRAAADNDAWHFLLQRLVANAFRRRPLFAEALLLVGFVFLIVAVEERPLRIAFRREDVRRDAVEEP